MAPSGEMSARARRLNMGLSGGNGGRGSRRIRMVGPRPGRHIGRRDDPGSVESR
ncbi:hypothetical protein PAI11_41030 [Patulibacter medicamentivorans]|uniref:Uncharacterized protein n=1 Tax=Patulibacter medicamentivorans TaxID=1097667 RepID=H0EB74_9ACTN|nr:hypothetical protein PAI11_41030 [Patulibacter medicamentivorans]